jgi:chemotaxis protein histidine kinase CheA
MAEDYFQISDGNRAIFIDFAGEAPQILAAMETALLKLSASGGRGHLLPVLRGLLTFKGIFGFLGMEEMRRLCDDAEHALEPFSGGAALGLDDIQTALRVCSLVRRQVSEIRRGLEADNFALVGSSLAAHD